MERTIFIDGKNQVKELIKHLDNPNLLLKNLSLRNPTLAKELFLNGTNFGALLNNLEDKQIALIFQMIEAPILGLAIREEEHSLQQRILRLADNSYALIAFEYMTRSFTNQKKGVERAKEKVLGVVKKMIRKV